MKFGPYITILLTQSFSRVYAATRFCGRGFAAFHFILLFLTTFSITLPAQCVVICKGSLNISLGVNGESIMTPGILLQDAQCNPADFSVSIVDGQGINYGNTVTCNNIGQTLTATVTQIATGNYCQTTLSISDYLPPFLTCKDTTIICTASFAPSVLGYPSVTDNCADLDSTELSYSDQVFDQPCFTQHQSDSITTRIERTWTAIDDHGNSNTCVQNIYLRRATLADIVFPLDLNGYDAPVLDCSQDPTDLALVGEPTIDGGRIDANGYCEFVITFSDQTVMNCAPAGYTIIRTWTIIDWCADDFTLHAQIIKVKDLTAPIISCPADLTVGTNVGDCNGSVLLPNASATDDCSAFTITPSWSFGSGYGPFSGVPIGTYAVTYTATDDCGNSSTCAINVTVVDNVPPIPVCDPVTNITLTTDGIGYANANSFNDGSNDNCGIGDILVSRDNVNYAEGVFFDCNDLENSPITLNIRVFDLAGNYNDCTVMAVIEDHLAPVVVCPSSAYLECHEDYLDLSITGQPLVQDNCEIDTIYFSDNIQLNSCNVGHLIRTWTAIDAFGNATSCLQTIYLNDNTPLLVSSFPSDYTTTTCGANLDPDITGMPVIINDDCELVYVGHQDDTLFIAYPACFVINRKWEIYDWCNYDGNANPVTGYWTNTQVLTVNDIENPILQIPADITVGSFSTNCGGAFVDLINATASDCSPNISITNNSTFANQSGANASGIYPIGTHTVYFIAQDGCGNIASQSMNITVVDSLAPSAICLSSLTLSIGPSGTVDLLPAMLDAGSTDNCTPAGDLILAVSPATFTCADLGSNSVAFSVTDANGNTDVCIAIVNIQNNMGQCPFVQLGGSIENENGTPVAGVTVAVNGGTDGTYTTTSDGQYSFQNLEIGMNYSIAPEKLSNSDNGVSTIDIILISRHLLGLTPITSPYKLIAGDVDNSQRVNTFDIIQIQKMILFIDTVFAASPSWRFVDADHVFADPSDPFASPFPQIIHLNNLQEDHLNGDFVAIKMGDINGNSNPFASQSQSTNRSESIPLTFNVEDKKFGAGEEFSVRMNAKELRDLLGFQFTLSFDPTILSLENMAFSQTAKRLGLSEKNFGWNYQEQGLITASWYSIDSEEIGEEEFITLNFKAKKAGRLSDYLKLNSQLTKAEAYQEEVGILDIKLEFKKVEESEPLLNKTLELKNFPNPFTTETTIAFSVDAPKEVVVTVFDTQGKAVFVWSGKEVSGAQEIYLDAVDLNLSNGLYFYQVKVAGEKKQIGKMMKVENH